MSITNKILLIWRSEIIGDFCENIKKHINTLSRQAKAKLKDKRNLNIKVSGTYIYTALCIIGLCDVTFEKFSIA